MKNEQTDFSRLREEAGISIDALAPLAGFSTSTLYRWERGEALPRQAAMLVLQNLAKARKPATPAAFFSFIDLFAGIGGLRRGFETIGGKCVFTSEWDRHAQATYRANYSCDHEIAGDITKIDPDDIPDHDVLLAGFPCQPFSIAGVSKKNALGRPHGFLCDTQGTLFFDTARIIAHHRPAAFVLENVKNLESHDGGKTFATIMNVLRSELGYHVQSRVISSAPWVPQKRERIFIVGFREPTAFDFQAVEPPPEDRGPKLGSILQDHKEVDPKYTLTPRLWEYLQAYKEKHTTKGNGFGYSLFGPDDVTRTLSARYYKDGSEILVAQPRKRPRRLTPLECARLMGFDQPGKPFLIPVSDTQAYRQFGNAVVVPVVEFVAKAMEPHLEVALATPNRRTSAVA